MIREAIRNAGAVVLQDLLRGVRDRVVIAVTFLAMLELMKRREIVVTQAEPWGPIVARVLGNVRPGAIVLMHDAGGPRAQTVAALPRIIAALRARHYGFATVPELLHLAPAIAWD